MLFHVTMSHGVDECPGLNPDKARQVMEMAGTLKELASHLNVKPAFELNGLPEHVEFAVLEAESPLAMAQYLSAAPMKREFKVTPVMRQEDVVAALGARPQP